MKPAAEAVRRRDFLKASAVVGGGAFLGSQVGWAWDLLARAERGDVGPGESYELAKAKNIIYSVCLQCHTACPIKGKILDGVLVRMDGSAYGPQTMQPHVPYRTTPWETAPVDGILCPKGQAGVQTLYDPYRIRKVLKRAGPRASNRWTAISFDQAIREIVEGGYLFKDVPGEENRYVPGLRDIYALRDPELAKAMAGDVEKIRQGQMTVPEFQAKHRDHLHLLIDPHHPDLGPKNNQFLFLAGRIQHGRKEFSQRWLKGGFGSINWFEHTTICEQSHHIAYEQMTNEYGAGKWQKGKTHMKPDALHSEFILFFGTGAFEANFGPTNMAGKITEGLVSGRLKIAVADPRLSKTAAKAWKWLPVKPGTDAALAMGMIRWIIQQDCYDRRFLENANKAAASADGEPSWTNASWLVKLEEDGRPKALLRARDVGLGSEDQFVVSREGRLQVVAPYDEARPVEGDLLAEGSIRGIRYASAFSLIKGEAFRHNPAEWGDLCGIEPPTIASVARELTSHGKRAAVEFYRGPVQHTNGYYTAQAIITLNLLIGNPDWQGGLQVGGGHWHEAGDKPGQPFNLVKGLHPGQLAAFGTNLTRERLSYENSTLFNGYPARRPWFPFTSNVYQEVLPSAADGYPYPIQALFLHMGTPIFSTPAGHLMIEYLRDTERLPLFFVDDVVIGETSMYADYIFPDLSIWERWGTPHQTPDVLSKASKVRQPMVGPIPEVVEVFGGQVPISMEAVMLAIAEQLGMPGHGEDGFGQNQPFTRPEDYYLKMAANIAAGDKPGDLVPKADMEEMRLFAEARRHLPHSVFDERRWMEAVGPNWWERVVFVLNRGGRFEEFAKGWTPPYVAHQLKGLINLYVEPVALAKHSMTGESFSGLPLMEQVKDMAGRTVVDDGYEFQLITFKEITGGHSRTPGNYWSQVAVLPENFVLMNAADAERLHLRKGERVRLLSPTNPEGVWNLGNGTRVPIEGKVKPLQGIRPGVAAVSWHYGHWAYGAGDVVVDGIRVKGDRRRAGGLCPNAAMRADDVLKNVCLTDPIGGSASFYDTRVKLVKV